MGVISRVCVGKIAICQAWSMEDEMEDMGQNWHEKIWGEQVKVRIITLLS